MRHTEERLDALLGREEEVLIEARSTRNAREWVGKTRCFKKVILPERSGISGMEAEPEISKGSFVQARITERRGLVLRGECLPSR